jgi:hypothetical protein
MMINMRLVCLVGSQTSSRRDSRASLHLDILSPMYYCILVLCPMRICLRLVIETSVEIVGLQFYRDISSTNVCLIISTLPEFSSYN